MIVWYCLSDLTTTQISARLANGIFRFAFTGTPGTPGTVLGTTNLVGDDVRRDGAKLRYQVGVPSGYAVQVDNRSTLELVKEP